MRFVVYGKPQGKARPRFTRQGHAYTPQATRKYEDLVRNSFREQSNGEFFGYSPIRLEIKAVFAPPKSKSKKLRADMLGGLVKPTTKPDCDNIIKIVADALNGVAYHDDKQVVECECKKVYGETEYVEITITEAQK